MGIGTIIIPDEGQHWITSGVLATIKKGESTIIEPEKCGEIGWFTIDEMNNLDLTIPTAKYVDILKSRS